MQKQAPTLGRILVMVLFALSCFGILLYLWLAFGGPTPLKPEGYRFKARFPESSLLVLEADVRIAGLNVGHVKSKALQRHGGTLVEMELDRKYAPIPADSRAMLRAKSILGQIYIELTPGSESAPKLPDGGILANANVQEPVEIDELIRTFDRPTRRAFRGWVRETAKAIQGGRGEDLNDALGNLDQWAASGADVLRILDEEDPALRRLIKNSGIVFAALNEREGQLRELIVNANDFFGALASRNDALAETIRIFPTFLDESRATLARLERFAQDTRPLVRDLTPVATELRPAVRDLRRLSPDLKRLFRDLGPLIDESGTTLPEAARFLRGAKPVFESLHTYLPELNPILSFANFQQQQLSDFFQNGSGSLNATLPALPGEGPRHYLRAYGAQNSRSLGIQRDRQNYDRGNAYPAPNYIKRIRPLGISEAWDCKPTGGEQRDPAQGLPPCFVQPPSLFDGRSFPRLARGEAPLRPPPGEYEGTKPPALP